MNKNRMLMLAELLETIPPVKFNIEYWASNYIEDTDEHSVQDDFTVLSGYDCSTAGCVAGWAVALKNDMAIENYRTDRIEEDAMEYLDLNRYEAQSLFYYGNDSIYAKYAGDLGLNNDFLLGHQIEAKHAAIAVRKLAEEEWSF